MTTQYWTAVRPMEEDLQPIFREEFEISVASLKRGKSANCLCHVLYNTPMHKVKFHNDTVVLFLRVNPSFIFTQHYISIFKKHGYISMFIPPFYSGKQLLFGFLVCFR